MSTSTSETGAFGALLRQHRLAASISQEVLGERSHLSVNAIAALERGRRTAPRPGTVILLADALSLTPAERAGLISAAAPARLGGRSKPNNNLPLQATVLLGREREVAAARDGLLQNDVRLVTLTGPGGTGKTRLALQVAAEMIDHFADGVFFVALAPVADYQLVPAIVAQTLGIRNVGGRPVLERLKDYVRDRALLLVLDNFEQILLAAPVVGELLGASRGLKVLVTSRAPLELRGEHELPVPPLALPDPQRLPTLEELPHYGAVALFIERATAIRPNFTVTEENALAVAEICVRLDGLPLAIELAAARIRILSSQQILARLVRRLPLLTGGARDLPARQQTLRGAIAWSYDLLDESERVLFRRLALFVAGFTLEAAQTVADPGRVLGLDVLDGVTSLVAKSLVRQEDGPNGEPRFGMLETIREYGLEQLEVSGELGPTRQRHAEFFLALAEEADPKLLGHEQIVWLRRLGADHNNMRAVLGWSRDRLITAEMGLRLAGALGMFWGVRGFAREARAWAEALLALPEAENWTAARARTLYAAALVALYQSDPEAIQAFAEESRAIFSAVGDLQWVGRALAMKAIGEGEHGNYPAARSSFAESAAIAREVGDRWGLAYSVGRLGYVSQFLGDYAAARTFREESAAIARAIGDRITLGRALAGLAQLARLEGKHEESYALFKEALTVSTDMEDSYVLPRAMAGLAGAVRLADDYERSARLFGAAEALREAGGTRELSVWRIAFDADLAALRAAMGDAALAAAWAEGRAMSTDQAVAYALGTTGPPGRGRPALQDRAPVLIDSLTEAPTV